MFAIVHTIHFNKKFVSRENIIFQVFHLFIQKQVEAFTVHLRFYFLKANLQVIPVIRLQCRVKVSPFHGVSVY